jgi:hypothetical protein
MRTLFATLLLTLSTVSLHSQLIDDFDDGDLSVNPTWLGNLSHFFTNSEGILRLNAVEPGRTFIHTPFEIPDSFNLSMQLGLEFSPSISNLARIYLFLDGLDLSKANGYYLNLGENGNEDAIRFYKLSNGTSLLLASGRLGAIANNLNDIALELTYNSKKEWKLRAAYDGRNVLTQEFVINEPWVITKSGYFAIECIYTVTRRDKMYFDNLNFDILTPDTQAPKLINNQVINDRTIEIEFSEEIVYPTVSNFVITPSISIDRINAASSTNNKFEIILQSPLVEGNTYNLSISNIQDLAGNVLTSSNIDIGLYKGPLENDIIISEILFDPLTDGDDYVELYNRSEKVINLRGSKIGNPSRNQFITITKDIFLVPRSYLCLTNNPLWVTENYKPPSEANILSNPLPLYNSTDGAASLVNETGDTIDAIQYTSNDHNKILNNVKGVSLERILNQNGNYENLWTSGVASTNFGTPGYENTNKLSSFEDIDNMFTILNKTFSPNGNGSNDEVLISYQLPKSGFVANVDVYGQDGYLIKNVTKGEFISTQGFFRWDGFNNKGEIERIGVYLIKGSLFHVDGERFNFSHSCILTNK